MSTFPNGIWAGFTVGVTLTAPQVQEIVNEIIALEQAAGLNPGTSSAFGALGTVDARLDNVESFLGLLGNTPLINLRVTNNAATPNSKIEFTAGVLAIEGAVVSVGSPIVIDMAVSGAGGRSTDLTEAANTWNYAYAIYNPATGVTSGLMSASQTAPALPAGYTKKRRIAAVRNDASSNFLRFFQQDQIVRYDGDDLTFQVVAAGVASTTVSSAISLGSWMPPTSRRAYLTGICHKPTGETGLRIRPNGSAQNGLGIAAAVDASSTNRNTAWCDTDATQQIQYSCSITVGGSPVYIYAWGFYDPI